MIMIVPLVCPPRTLVVSVVIKIYTRYHLIFEYGPKQRKTVAFARAEEGVASSP
jgi:hypothetical protein